MGTWEEEEEEEEEEAHEGMEVICGRGIGLANGISSWKETKSARSLMIPPPEEEIEKRVEVWRVTRWWRASVRSSRFDCVRLEVLAKAEADLAMASRYLVATTVRALSAESWVTLYPTDWQICDTAILAMANENSDGFWGSS